MLHKIENSADTERRESQRDPQNIDGFAFLENIATPWEVSEIRRAAARVQFLAGLKTRQLGSVAVHRKSLKSRMFSNSLRSVKK